jgi:predicted ABC-type ATPase
MERVKPQLVVVAGPNGSGKTTFAREYLEAHPCPYLSADVIAESMRPEPFEDVRLKAGRVFHRHVSTQIQATASCVVESTLSGLTFSRLLNDARAAGYEVAIIFVFFGLAPK